MCHITFFSYFCIYLKGNSYLAVYLAGLVVGNSRFVHKRSTRNFFDAVTWLAQLAMFPPPTSFGVALERKKRGRRW